MSLKLVWDSEKKYLNLETSFLEVDGTLFFDFNNLLEFLNYNEYVYKHSTNALKIDKKDLESFKANIIHHSVQCENIIINCFNFSLNSSEGLKLYDLTMIKESNAALTEIDINDIFNNFESIIEDSFNSRQGSYKLVNLLLNTLNELKTA